MQRNQRILLPPFRFMTVYCHTKPAITFSPFQPSLDHHRVYSYYTLFPASIRVYTIVRGIILLLLSPTHGCISFRLPFFSHQAQRKVIIIIIIIIAIVIITIIITTTTETKYLRVLFKRLWRRRAILNVRQTNQKTGNVLWDDDGDADYNKLRRLTRVELRSKNQWEMWSVITLECGVLLTQNEREWPSNLTNDEWTRSALLARVTGARKRKNDL